MSAFSDLGHSNLTLPDGAVTHSNPPELSLIVPLRLPARVVRFEVGWDTLTPGQIYKRIKARLEAEGGVTWRSRFDPVREYYVGGLRTFNEAYHAVVESPEAKAEREKWEALAAQNKAEEVKRLKGNHRNLSIAKNRAFREKYCSSKNAVVLQ